MICSFRIKNAFYSDKKVLEDIDFELDEGDILVIVGESGAGKTTLGRIVSGLYRFYPLKFSGEIILKARIDVIPQNIMDSLDPLFTIQQHFAEIERDRMVVRKTLAKVGFHDVDNILNSYPHNLSGGMIQRVLIALALLKAKIILADEFTSALDNITKLRVLSLFKWLNKEEGVSLIFITHDLELMDFEGKIIVLFDGKVLEQGAISQIKKEPIHPYTKFLLSASPKIGMHHRSSRFMQININRNFACPFVDSCGKAEAICKVAVPPLKKVGGRYVRCHF